MDHLHLTTDKLSVEAVSELVLDDSCGAVSVFVGTTRDNFEGKKVVRLEYEAYEDMALKALKNLCNDMREKWPDVHGIAIHHRLGAVPSREASVVLAVSSPHRQASLAAVAHCIEQLKATVPIWKKEVYDGEASAWKQNKECVQTNQFLKLEPTITPAETIDKNLIQVNVNNEGLRIRMENFMKMKRELVNLSNIHDFIPSKGQGSEADEENSCARCRTVFVKRGDSKGHLKVHRVTNEWGPQTVRAPAAGGGAGGGGGGGGALPGGVEERVRDVERYLGVRAVQPDVYRRLKEMEDRIRHLEAVSPEYAQFWRNNSSKSPGADERTAKMDCRFTADEIDRKIEQLEKQNSTQWRTSSEY